MDLTVTTPTRRSRERLKDHHGRDDDGDRPPAARGAVSGGWFA